MPKSMAAYLESDFECEGLLECIHGLSMLDRETFQVLAESDHALSIDDLATRLDRERSTAYRSVQRLRDAGLVQQDQRNYDDGGYYHVYRTGATDEIAVAMQHIINEWYAEVDALITSFRESYDITPRTSERETE